jgi:type IV secretory pathway VirB2 component (pilin)
MADMKTDHTIGTTCVLVLLLIAVAVLVVLSDAASAQDLGGPEVGWTRLAEDVMFSADRLATIVPVIGLVLLGAAIIFGFHMSPILQLITAAAILLLGPAAFSLIMGAELPPGVRP